MSSKDILLTVSEKIDILSYMEEQLQKDITKLDEYKEKVKKVSPNNSKLLEIIRKSENSIKRRKVRIEYEKKRQILF